MCRIWYVGYAEPLKVPLAKVYKMASLIWSCRLRKLQQKVQSNYYIRIVIVFLNSLSICCFVEKVVISRPK